MTGRFPHLMITHASRSYPAVRSSCLRLLALFAAAALFSVHAGAQTALIVQSNGKPEFVRKAAGAVAYIQRDGQWVSVAEGPFALQPATEYVPILVSVKNLSFKKGERAISDEGASTSHLVHAGRFVYTADFEADADLANVVLVLDLNSKQIGQYVYVHELGDLKAHHSVHMSIDEITKFRLFGVQLRGTHLYTNGRELFTSDVSEGKRRAALDAMVAARVAAGKDAPITPLAVYDPVYPASLQSKQPGEATIVLRVDAQGNPHDAKVAAATAPAFGDAALQAIQYWRFTPEIKNRTAIESTAKVPFKFEAP